MKTKALIIIFFALMLSAAAMASEKKRHIQILVDAQKSHDTEIHEVHKIRIVREEVDVTN